MLSSPKLGEDAFLLHLAIESPEQTLEALLFIKPYLSHIIHLLSRSDSSEHHILRIF